MTLQLIQIVLALDWPFHQKLERPLQDSEAWSLQPSKKVIPTQFKVSHSNTIVDRPLQNITSTNKKWLSLFIRLQYRKIMNFSVTLTLWKRICLVRHQILSSQPLIENLSSNLQCGEIFHSIKLKMQYQENLSVALFLELRGLNWTSSQILCLRDHTPRIYQRTALKRSFHRLKRSKFFLSKSSPQITVWS